MQNNNKLTLAEAMGMKIESRSQQARWYDELDKELAARGYEVISDTPAFDFIGSESPEAPSVDRALANMRKKGMSPADAVDALEDRDEFWNDWA